MVRRIIVVEDIAEEAASVEEVLDLLQNNGFKAYQISNVFYTSDNPPPAHQTGTGPLPAIGNDKSALETLLNQKTLLENELRKYRTLLENSGDILYALDFAGNITFVTSNVREILGYQPEEIVGKNFLSLLPPAQHDYSVRVLNEQQHGSTRNTFRPDLIAKDGHLLPVEISARAYYEDDLPVLQIGLIRDITERKKLEAAMVKHNRELSALYSVASALTCSLDLETLLDECLARMMTAMGADSGCIFLLNSDGEFRQGTQRGFDDDFKKIYPSLQTRWHEIEAVMRRGEAIILEDLANLPGVDLELLAETGYRSMALGPLRANNAILGTFMLMSKGTHTFTQSDHDLFLSLGNQVGLALQTGTLYSELNDTVSELRRTNQQLDDATRHKSEFLAAMSHELRTPLNPIIGFSEALQDQIFGTLNEKQLRWVNNILNSGRHLLALVNDVLDLAKVEAGKMELNLEPLNPMEVINETQMTVVTLANKKQISLTNHRSETLPVIKADRGKLKQILYNLYSNAVKFTPEGGRVETHIKVAQHSDGDYLEIAVIDNGIGIRPEDHERIFEEFQMVDGTLAKKQSGTGLGLALCRKLTQMHNGTVTVKSALGEGSTFTVALPLNLTVPVFTNSTKLSAHQPNPAPKDIWQTQMQKILKDSNQDLVLVVEDDDKAAELLELYITQNGSRVERSRSGEEALQKARLLQPSVITLDIVLPHKNGWDVLRELKADPQTSDIPVLVVSMLDDREISFELGAVACFVKPVQRDELLQKVAELKQAAAKRKRQAQIDEHLLHGEPLRALVIDDNSQDAEYLKDILGHAGLNVSVARNGAEGWQAARENPPDIVVLDMVLPDTDGFNVLAQLRRDEATLDVPVVVFTAKDLNSDERGFLAERTDAVLQKGTQGRQQLLDEILKLSTAHR